MIGHMRAFGVQVRLCSEVGADHPDHFRSTARRMAGEMDGAFISTYLYQMLRINIQVWRFLALNPAA
jgi:hypothetical protein